jgi:beta-lactamase regulating signal transducer with metallopeptidase domain
MSWLYDTFVWTAALIAMVLVVRRAVSRHFGPKAAYALWLVPLARLVLPPFVLPSWLAPASDMTAAQGEAATFVALPVDSLPSSTAASTLPFDWQALLVTVWAAGAATYIVMRLLSYFRLRRDLLAGARSVGFEGRIRLLETPGTASPLAFGVFDKVVALPPGFMAWSDRRARDLALSHELAHHRAHDLAFNFCALPLFALHWFNPLSLLGWRAMRRDQEAACDARVVEHRDRLDRVAYALLIASAVAGPRGALAAPMACPVLGDKSIVHRLRNLAMTTPSNRRRRIGALLVGASMLLVPLTASITYAQDEAAEAPPPPAPPAPPMVPVAPEAPLPPEAPAAYVVHDIAPDGTRRERRVRVVRVDKDDAADARRAIRERRVIRTRDGEAFDEEAFEKQMEALDDQLEHLGEDIEKRVIVDHRRIARISRDSARAARRAAVAVARAPRVVMNCDGDDEVSDTTGPDGKRTIRICRQRIERSAVAGLRAARERVAGETEMREDTRQEVLRSLDREIERLEAGD